MDKIWYTADDEEPMCIRCELFESDDICVERCGPNHGWNLYCRSEFVEESNIDEENLAIV